MARNRMKGMILRGISFFTACIFLVSQVTFANPGVGIEIAANREVPGFLRIDIPTELASLDGIWEAPPSADSRVVLHIQNAHANYGAQKKIQLLLEYLNKTYAIKTIFVEGAAEDLNPDYLKLFPDKARNLELADLLAQQGELTGAELFILHEDKEYGAKSSESGIRATDQGPKDLGSRTPNSSLPSGPVRGVGIEDAGLYRQNYEALKKVFGAETLVNRYLKGYESRLEALSSKIFTNDLRRVLSDWQKFEKGHREFMPYIRSLAAEAKRVLKLDLESLFSQVEWPQITRLLVLQGMEKELDTAKALEEKDRLINFLKAKGVSQRIIAEVENFKEQRLSVRQGQGEMMEPRDVLEALSMEAGPQGFRFSDYPAFSLYAGYLVLKSELDAKGLFEEIKVLFEKILNSLAASSDQKALLELYRDEELARKLLRLELSRRDWKDALGRKTEIQMDSMVSRLKDLSIAVTKEMNLAPSDLETKKLSPQFQGQILDLYGSAFSFYEFARQRESMFYEKINAVMGEGPSSKAILITGGFHTDGMTDLFREHNISYGVLTPRLMEKSDEKLYRNTMLQNEKQLFSISYLELALKLQSSEVFDAQGFVSLEKLGTEWKNFMKVGHFESVQAAIDVFNVSVAATQADPGYILKLSLAGKDESGKERLKLEKFARSEAMMNEANKILMEANALLQKLPELTKGDLQGGMEAPVARSEMRGGLIAVVLLFTGMLFYFGMQIGQSGVAAIDASKDRAFLVEVQSGVLQGLPDALGVTESAIQGFLPEVVEIRTDWVKLRRSEHLPTDSPTFVAALRGWLREGVVAHPDLQGKVQDLSMKILLSGARSEVRLIGDPLGIAAIYYDKVLGERDAAATGDEEVESLRVLIQKSLSEEIQDSIRALNAATLPTATFNSAVQGRRAMDDKSFVESFQQHIAGGLDYAFGDKENDERSRLETEIANILKSDYPKKRDQRDQLVEVEARVTRIVGRRLQDASLRLGSPSRQMELITGFNQGKRNAPSDKELFVKDFLRRAKDALVVILDFNKTTLRKELWKNLELIAKTAKPEDARVSETAKEYQELTLSATDARQLVPAIKFVLEYEKARQAASRSEARFGEQDLGELQTIYNGLSQAGLAEKVGQDKLLAASGLTSHIMLLSVLINEANIPDAGRTVVEKHEQLFTSAAQILVDLEGMVPEARRDAMFSGLLGRLERFVDTQADGAAMLSRLRSGSIVRSEARVTEAEKDVALRVASIMKDLNQGQIDSLKGTTFDALAAMTKDFKRSEFDNLSPEMQVTVALTRGIASLENFEAAASLFAQLASLVQPHTRTGIVSALRAAVPETPVAISEEKGDALLWLDGLGDKNALQNALEALLFLNPNMTYHLGVFDGRADAPGTAKDIVKAIDAAGFKGQVKIKVMDPTKRINSQRGIRNLYNGLNGKSYVTSGNEQAQGWVSGSGVETQNIMPFLMQNPDLANVSQADKTGIFPAVMAVVTRGAQRVATAKVTTLPQMVQLLMQIPDKERGFIINSAGQPEINATSLGNFIKAMGALLRAYESIRTAA